MNIGPNKDNILKGITHIKPNKDNTPKGNNTKAPSNNYNKSRATATNNSESNG